MKDFFESLSKTIAHADITLSMKELAEQHVEFHMTQFISQEEGWTMKECQRNLALWQGFMNLVKAKYPDVKDPLGGE